MQTFTIEKQVKEYPIQASVTKMEQDVHILLAGGTLPHIGAISVYQNEVELSSIQFEGHKEEVVSRMWAKELSANYPEKITVACGIHYDNASSSLIQEIVKQTKELLQVVIQTIDNIMKEGK